MGSAPVGAAQIAGGLRGSCAVEQRGDGCEREGVAELGPDDQRGAQPEEHFEHGHARILADGRGGP